MRPLNFLKLAKLEGLLIIGYCGLLSKGIFIVQTSFCLMCKLFSLATYVRDFDHKQDNNEMNNVDMGIPCKFKIFKQFLVSILKTSLFEYLLVLLPHKLVNLVGLFSLLH